MNWARHVVASGALWLVLACSPELSFPDGAYIACASNDDCPAAYVCRTTIGRCVAPTADGEAPRLETVEPSTSIIGPSQPITLGLVVSEPLAQEPVVTLGSPEHPQFTLKSQTNLRYEYEFVPTSADTEGNWPVLVDLVDVAGNRASQLAATTLTVDVTAPAAVAPSAILYPDAANVLQRVTAIRNGAKYAAYFSVTEPLAEPPTVIARCAETDLALARKPGETDVAFFTYTFTLGADLVVADGACPLVATLRDLANNQVTEQPLAPLVMQVDRTAPDESLAMALDQVQHLRIPWGALQTAGAQGQYLTPIDLDWDTDPLSAEIGADTFFDGAPGQLAQVRVYASASGGLLLGVSQPAGSGWAVPRLVGDTSELWLTVVDLAGNESGRRRVPHVQWVSTLGRKVPGSTFENPAVARVSPRLDPWLLQSAAEAPELDTAQIAALATVDQDSVEARARGRWQRMPPVSTTLPFPNGASMTYDPVSGRIYAFSENTLTNKSELWEWNSTSGIWKQTDADAEYRPQARQEAGLCADARHGRIVVFSGRTSSTFGDTWEWDLASRQWLLRVADDPTDYEQLRRVTPLAYDSRRGRCVFFGGEYYESFNDVWEWDSDAGRWLERPSTNEPPNVRAGHGWSYDAEHHRMLLFGGVWPTYNTDTNPCPADSQRDTVTDPPWYRCYFGDTWAWDPDQARWSKLAGLAAGPGARTEHTQAFDASLSGLFLFGGVGNSPWWRDDLWEFVDDTWQRRTPDGVGPALRYRAAAAFDPNRRRVFMFRGRHGSGVYAEQWEWDSTANLWVNRLGNGQRPPPRGRARMVADTLHGGTYLYGGYDSMAGGRRDIWRYDGASGQWSEEVPGATQPPTSESVPAIAYVHSRDSLVLLQQSNTGAAMTMWEYAPASNTWSVRNQSGSLPPPRGDTAIVYDRANDRIVLFGGRHTDYAATTCPDSSPMVNNTCYYRDLFEWNPATGVWTSRAFAGGPAARFAHDMVYNPVRHTVQIVGGCARETWCTYANDSWEWDSAAGTMMPFAAAELDPNPAGQMRFSLAFDTLRERTILASGTRKTRGFWEWDAVSQSWVERLGLGDMPEEDEFQTVGFDLQSEQLLLFGGSNQPSDFWVWHSEAQSRPALLFSVPLAASGILTNEPSAIAVRVVGGGLGYQARAAQPGVGIYIWNSGVWSTVGQNAAATPSAPLAVIGSVDHAVTVHSMMYGRERYLHMAVAPLAPSAQSPEPASLAVDYLELRVEFDDP